MEDKYIALIGLGVVGAPLANLLFKKFKKNFILLSSKELLPTLKNIYINGDYFSPNVVYKKSQLKKRVGVVFVCVKNYQLDGVIKLLHHLINEETIIVPLQNGIYSYDTFRNKFPTNIVLEGFAQGPNTNILKNIYNYQKPGIFHIGSSKDEWKIFAKQIVDEMISANINSLYDENIRHEVWKKLMLNVAGNAITALTGIDYCMFVKSSETQLLCRETMKEFMAVANFLGVGITDKDIEDTIAYFLSFKVSKKTSMLEDVTNLRPTENDYIAGYVYQVAKELSIATPHIETLYNLVRIKEDVYSKRI